MSLEQATLVRPDTVYSSRLVNGFHEFRGSKIDDEVDSHLRRVESSIEYHKRAAAMGCFAPGEVTARAFYEVMIRPYLLKGLLNSETCERTFVPDRKYIDDFVKQMLESGVISQMYIRLLQSRPGELPTDSRISYGALELLRTWAIRVRVAKQLNLKYAVNIVDETEAFDHRDQLGFTDEAIADSYSAMRYLLEEYGLNENDLWITPFSHQARLYRGSGVQNDELSKEYEQSMARNIAKTQAEISIGNYSLSAIRAVMIHRLRHGDGFTSVSANRDFDYLTKSWKTDFDETLFVSESFNTAMQMRLATKRYVGRVGLRAAFPEFFNSATLMHWGISKKTDRLSIQPNFRVYKGRLVTPGYALPVYGQDGQQFLGLTGYTEMANDHFDIIEGPNSLPAALVKLE